MKQAHVLTPRALTSRVLCCQAADEDSLTVVRKLKLKYDGLLQGSNPESTSLTSGQMLLMGFNGLFTRYSRHTTERPVLEISRLICGMHSMLTLTVV